MKCVLVDAEGLRDSFGDALLLLSDERREKALSYVFEKDRFLSAAAGLFFRYIETRYGTDILYGVNGKPYCKDPRIQFNLSHSGHYVAFAESDCPVGIDIEEIGSHPDIFRTVMTEKEYGNFMRHPKDELDDLFCRMWTVKESYMKAVGSGLTIPPDSFSVIESDGMRHNGFPHGLIVHELEAPEGYHASVCSKGEQAVNVTSISIDELIDAISSIRPL